MSSKLIIRALKCGRKGLKARPKWEKEEEAEREGMINVKQKSGVHI
jgi:hypothetical protein